MYKYQGVPITDLHDIKVGDLVEVYDLKTPLKIVEINKYSAGLKGKRTYYSLSYNINSGKLFVLSKSGKDLGFKRIIKV